MEQKKKKNKKIFVLLFHIFLFVTVFFFHSTGYNKVLAGYMSNETNVLKLGQKDPKISRNNFEDVQTVIDDATIAEQVEAKQTINHTWELTETVDAKCFEDGHNTYVCSDCGATYTEVLPMTGHDWADDKVEPTCTERGYTRHTCWKCWETHTDNYVPALGHNYVVTEEDLTEHDDATNVTKHYKVYTCTRCGDSYRDFVRAEFGYRGAVQEFVVEKDGIYKVEAWGAGSGSGEKGGYISGEVELHEGDVLYVAVGGQGGAGSSGVKGRTGGGAGGWNGGGAGGNAGNRNGWKGGGAGGGGATSIAKADADATDEEKAALEDKTLAQIGKEEFDENGLIVAGGAGGANYDTGRTGGMQGGNNNPGTTSFGQGYNGRAGRNASNQGWGGGGGGGGYYGGYSAPYNTYKSQPNGGSSWSNENEVEDVATQTGVQSGNGAAVIEFVSDLPVEEPEEELPEPEEDTTPEDEEPTPTEEATE